ncbi:tRNA-intron endonuclease catalytic [Glarea lozoyensis ATCC 20868]|uniref:tRNA-intron lyase n=1 Tax=Glarea lozoyensis (strain ATCC 20868 / MF5171) TaxID=1116229 RepID=S3D6H6_GLAL2|nr:tRNA-intron endonuclease catalytic [Glarea lozoyensis ATCC 20868]EPE33335.1 tRNA-intron endonuclease catalytic [Glarea lozoyensis ATCC 20868]
MADTANKPTVSSGDAATSSATPSNPPRTNKNSASKNKQALNKLYALPAPLRTFPIPSFVPQNPISLFHVLYAWVSQALSLKSSAFDPLYQGWFSPETRSIHVTDARSIRGLWEQGFYGKGNLSRSEPNWLKGEKDKRATGKGKARTSEENTLRRRAERQQVKWERARLQKEAIDQKIFEEATANSSHIVVNGNSLPLEAASEPAEKSSLLALNLRDEPVSISQIPHLPPPVGPLELLRLPNSDTESVHGIFNFMHQKPPLQDEFVFPNLAPLKIPPRLFPSPVGPLELLALPNSIDPLSPVDVESIESVSSFEEKPGYISPTESPDEDLIVHDSKINGGGLAHASPNGHAKSNVVCRPQDVEEEVDHPAKKLQEPINGVAALPPSPKIKRQKSVRFSPTIEHNTFIKSEPPSPVRKVEAASSTSIVETIPALAEELVEIKDQEHTQLSLEEAFFLSYGMGALHILDPESKTPIPNNRLFDLFRRTSYFPPRSDAATLAPDDPFMLNYVVYHHFRSLGWVVRSGIKFAVDYMLYVRGPVFNHAEFAVVILPSYSDSFYDNDTAAKAKERKTWAWMSCVNRVITQVRKTLLLVYVDIPKPLEAEEELKLGIDGVLARYKVREVVMNRWVSNRQRK